MDIFEVITQRQFIFIHQCLKDPFENPYNIVNLGVDEIDSLINRQICWFHHTSEPRHWHVSFNGRWIYFLYEKELKKKSHAFVP